MSVAGWEKKRGKSAHNTVDADLPPFKSNF